MKNLALIILLISYNLYSQKQYKIQTIAFYNVENLFDTIESVGIIDGTKKYWEQGYHKSFYKNSIEVLTSEKNDKQLTYENLEGRKVKRNLILSEDYTPKGKYNWNYKKYHAKLDQITKVISEIGVDKAKVPPLIIGLAELENEHVLRDIINHPNLKLYNYGMVHFNSFDARGIDVGLIYRKDQFKIEKAIPHPVVIYNEKKHREYTRDIIHVSGYLDDEKIHFLVNHWPSKRGGEKASEYKRIKAAKTCLSIIDLIKQKEPNAKIIIMGDFNDGPNNKSVKALRMVNNEEKIKADLLYNPMGILSKNGEGTAAYKDRWETLDQFMLSYNLINRQFNTYTYYATNIFKPSYLTVQLGKYKGYPFRTFTHGKYLGGYSDHYPIYLYLIKEYIE